MGTLHPTRELSCVALAAAVAVAAPVARSQPAAAPGSVQSQLDALREQLAGQQRLVEQLRQQLQEHEERYRRLVQQQPEAAPPAQPGAEGAASPAAAGDADGRARAVQIGTAPAAPEPVAPAQLFEQPGVLTPRGRVVLEPSLQYGYSSSSRVALVGFTVIPALLVGLIDVREVRRNTVTAALTVRYGLTSRAEIEARVPYVRRWDSTVSRERLAGAGTDSVFSSEGTHIGDIEITGRYQLTEGRGRLPYLIGSLRLKSRTGRDPFEVVTDCVTRCVSDTNATGTGEPLDLPTGSGFVTVQPAITWLYPSDPAVFFGSFSYAYNVKRRNVSRQVLGGEREFLGDIKAGNAFGFNVGMGLALNERTSFSLGVEASSLGRIRQNGAPVPGSVRTTLASLLLGFSHVWDSHRTINLAIGAGLTRDTPDLTLTLRVPFML